MDIFRIDFLAVLFWRARAKITDRLSNVGSRALDDALHARVIALNLLIAFLRRIRNVEWNVSLRLIEHGISN